MSAELQNFLARCTWLFEQRGVLSTGYTADMLRTLAVHRTLFLDGKPRGLGGLGSPSADTLEKCLVRMTNWLQLCRHTIAAEFPEFETLQAFSCFALDRQPTPVTINGGLQKLAGVLGLDCAKLHAQFHDIRTIAERKFASGAECHESWAEAVREVRRTSKTRASHPHDVLAAALGRHIAWNSSTSGVERLFSRAYCSASLARGAVSEARIDDEIQVLAGCDHDLVLCEAARKVWAATSGPPRSSPQLRLDAGVTEQHSEGRAT